jgi:hypothetical protein
VLGVLAGLFELVPIFGPILSAVRAVLVALFMPFPTRRRRLFMPSRSTTARPESRPGYDCRISSVGLGRMRRVVLHQRDASSISQSTLPSGV